MVSEDGELLVLYVMESTTGNGIYYADFNVVELSLTESDDVLVVEDTLVHAATSIFAGSGADSFEIAGISGPVQLEMGNGDSR